MQRFLVSSLVLISIVFSSYAGAFQKGIYLSQATLMNKAKLDYLISRSKAAGINTFIVDIKHPNRGYSLHIQKFKSKGIRYVARVVVFKSGGRPKQVHSKEHWRKIYRLVDYAVKAGADEIQLDYIRYSSKQRPSKQNTRDIHKVIKWFRHKLPSNIPLQIDVFGVVSFREVTSIGQSAPLFSDTVQAICPMVYPSHYEPYRVHAKQPYKTILDSLLALRRQFVEPMPMALYPYIELYNYRYPMTYTQKIEYIREQMRAAVDAKSDGWYVWNARNQYDILFNLLTMPK